MVGEHAAAGSIGLSGLLDSQFCTRITERGGAVVALRMAR